jgi:hypothetical protein
MLRRETKYNSVLVVPAVSVPYNPEAGQTEPPTLLMGVQQVLFRRFPDVPSGRRGPTALVRPLAIDQPSRSTSCVVRSLCARYADMCPRRVAQANLSVRLSW